MSISGAQPGYPSAQPNQFTIAEADMDMPFATAVAHVDEANEKHRIFEAKAQNSSDNLAGQSQGIQDWPLGLRNKLIQTFKKPPNERRGGEYLARYEWPDGLKSTIYKSCKKIPLRFFIIDDSGSMILNDGKKVMKHGNQTKMVKCTRWEELTGTMKFLGELSEELGAPSEFRLLNGSDPIIVGLGDDNGKSLAFLKEVMSDSPAGPTPLCNHINAVVRSIQSIADVLRANNQKVTVMIATDGESSDGNVADALRPLTNMPVLVILRLCTSEKEVVEYWNNIDQQLELDIDVLDDQLGDARQVREQNAWLTYGEPLHRLREFGASMKEMDIIDESTVSSEQMRVLCSYLYTGGDMEELPHPGVDWRAFSNKIKELNRTVPMVFCPLNNAMRPWVDVKQLNTMYAGEYTQSSACSIM